MKNYNCLFFGGKIPERHPKKKLKKTPMTKGFRLPNRSPNWPLKMQPIKNPTKTEEPKILC